MAGRNSRPFLIVPWDDDFLARIHTLTYEMTGGAPGKAVIVFPLNRPRRYLLDIYRRQASQPLLLPTMINVEQLTQICLDSWDHSVPRRASTLDQVALLRDTVLAVSRDEEASSPLGALSRQLAAEDGMARFFPWGVRLAHLLDECARHLINALDMRHLENEVAPFAAALLSGLRRIQEDYRLRLRSQGLSTAGQDAQRAALLASASPDLPLKLQGKKIILAGFVRLTASEDSLFRYLWENGAEVCLNTDPEVASGGGHWSCADHREWLSRWKAKTTVLGEGNGSAPHIHFFAGYDLHSQLKELRSELEEHPHKDERRAVVLSHDSLLMPTLHHIPEKDINISLGYPLERSLLARLIERILQTQERMDDDGRVYWRDLLDLVRHPYVRMLALSREEEAPLPLRSFLMLMEQTLRSGTRMVNPATLVEDLLDETLGDLENSHPDDVTEETGALLSTVIHILVTDWRSIHTLQALSDCLRGLCGMLRTFGEHLWKDFPLDAECLSRLTQSVIPALCDNALAEVPLSRSTLFAVLRQELSEQRVAFEADPLTGLQILGPLETRLLRFDRVYLLDLTEDALPGSPAQDPLLPDSLRHELGLPDTQHRDMLAAHTFYRLLAGAKEVFLYWQEGVSSGLLDAKKNRSRFVEEALWEEEQRQKKRLKPGDFPLEAAAFPLSDVPQPEKRLIERTPAVNARMDELLARKLSPTMLDEYLTCPARFFYHRLCGLKELQEVMEKDDPLGVGTMLHLVLKRAYEPFVGKSIQESDIDPDTLNRLFREEMDASGLTGTLPAQSRFMLETAGPIRLQNFLKHQPKTLKLVQVEHESTAVLQTEKRLFHLGGTLDRLDVREEGLVILDYKTGSRLPQPGRGFWEDDNLWKAMAAWTPGAEDTLEELSSRIHSVQLPCYLYLCGNDPRNEELLSRYPLSDAAWVHLADQGEELFLFGSAPDKAYREDMLRRRIPELLSFILRHMATASTFSPHDGKECKYCPYTSCCIH